MGKEWDTFTRGRIKNLQNPETLGNPSNSVGTHNVKIKGTGFKALPKMQDRLNPKCSTCNHYRWSGTPCNCENPKWEIQTEARDMFIQFMADVFSEGLRVLKPGGHALVWALPRTSHWTAMGLERAGFEIRDCVSHVFSTGFPKSLNINKSLEKQGLACTCSESMLYSKYDKNKKARPNLRDMQETISPKKPQKIGQMPILHEQVSGSMEVNRPTNKETSKRDFFNGGDSGKQTREQVEKGNENGKESSVEGGNNLQEKQGKLYRPEIHKVSERISENGKERWVCDGAQVSDGSILKQDIKESGDSSSQESQYEGQSDRKLTAFQEQPGTQICRRCGKAIIEKGLGTALKPAVEFWWLCRKPLSEKTIAENCLKWGTGGLSIDECRVGTETRTNKRNESASINNPYTKGLRGVETEVKNYGRFPANLITDGSPEVVALFPKTKSGSHIKGKPNGSNAAFGKELNRINDYDIPANEGSASRFFYTAKASRSERNMGCEGLEEKQQDENRKEGNPGGDNPRNRGVNPQTNFHPTVKPIKLMEYLVKLISRKGQIVLDPFAGSGSTLIACERLNRKWIGIEKEEDYVKIANARIKAELAQQKLL